MDVEVELPSLVNMKAAPFVPPGWEVALHRPTASVRNFQNQFKFLLTVEQRAGLVLGHELRTRLEGCKVVNANLLDYLLARLKYNPRFLSDRWKYDNEYRSRYIFFWGTIYRNEGELCVRCLHWNGLQWESSYCWLSNQWNSYYVALVYA